MRVFLLTKSASGNSQNSSLLDHLHAIHDIGCHTLIFSRLNGLLRKINRWEAIHSSFNFLAVCVAHVVKGLSKELSPCLHTRVNLLALFVIKFNTLRRLSSFLWWINHKFSSYLSNRVAANLDRLKLIHHVLGILVQVDCFHIATS